MAEIERIISFKLQFIQATTVPERVLILKSQILPAMFNYWAEIGREPKDEEESRAQAKVTIQVVIEADN